MGDSGPGGVAVCGGRGSMVAVSIPQTVLGAMRACGVPLPSWFPAADPAKETQDLEVRADCARLLALADVAGEAAWECWQAAGEPEADTAAVACSDLVEVLEQAVVGVLLGREVLVDDVWMMTDPDDDLQRPTVHRGTVASVRTAPVLEVTLATDSGRTLTVSRHMWTVSDRATRQVLYGPRDGAASLGVFQVFRSAGPRG
ncbi:hypothetical protein [Streptomyces sp. NPDC002889]|uniref:hypothetical protein n=1 Tax=Streptomyces sp. NPDC002889 TaxID=3364669 RepID=UPI00367F2699